MVLVPVPCTQTPDLGAGARPMSSPSSLGPSSSRTWSRSTHRDLGRCCLGVSAEPDWPLPCREGRWAWGEGQGSQRLALGDPSSRAPRSAVPQMPAPGMGGHLHFLGQLQQGDVITIELQDSLMLLGKDVEPRGDHHLLNLEFFAQMGVGIPWEQYGRLG